MPSTFHGSMRKAAVACGVTKNAVNDSLANLRKNAALKGYSPEHDYTKPVPDPYIVKGVSTYYGKDGTVTGQWVKSSLDTEKLVGMLKVVVAAMNEEINPVAPITAPTAELNEKLLNLFTLTDTHIGMVSWMSETGNEWNLENSRRYPYRRIPPPYTQLSTSKNLYNKRVRRFSSFRFFRRCNADQSKLAGCRRSVPAVDRNGSAGLAVRHFRSSDQARNGHTRHL